MTTRARTAIITGATSGIGLATARTLSRNGLRILGVGRDERRVKEVAQELGPGFRALTCDLSVPEQRSALARQLAELPEGPHVLINNAAECVFESPLELDPLRLLELFQVNVIACVELSRAAASRMSAGGHVVQLSSVTARFVASAKFASYAATKHAVDQLTQALRWELHPRGVSVTTIFPGLVDTPIYDKVDGFEQVGSKLRKALPRWLDAQDVAETIEWVITRPPHLVVSELTVLPRGQAR